MAKVTGIRFLCVLLAALLCSTMIGCGSGGHNSPQAAFDAMKTAGEKKDWKGLSECLTPDSRDAMAGSMVIAGSMMKAMSAFAAMAPAEDAEKMKTALKNIDEILKKHGIDEEAMEKMQKKTEGKKPDDPKEVLALLKEIAAPIKDKPAFIGDMMKALDEMSDDDSSGMSFDNATLKDVKVDGDTATATIVKKTDDGEESDPIAFRKVDGGWLVEIPLDEMGPGGGGML